jgi:hypothetical protein
MYTGIGDCAQKMYVQEGLPGLFRGSAVSVVRIAPQFGISLLAYEKLSEATHSIIVIIIFDYNELLITLWRYSN